MDILCLLFLDDLGHLMIESHLLGLAQLFLLMKEYQPALVIPTVDSLDESAAFQNGVIVPLDLKHPPILLNAYGCIPLLLSPLLSLTILISTHFHQRT
jgi:hypothetical protein